MTEPLSIEAATAAREAAYAAHENVIAEIKIAEAALAANAPAAAVAGGINLADASRAQIDAQHRLEFLHKASDETWRLVLEADAAIKFAHTYREWAEKLSRAIGSRIAAIEAREAALAARAKAEEDYMAATNIIAAAYSHGMPKPPKLHEYPLYLGATVDHSTKIIMRTSEEEKWFWGVA